MKGITMREHIQNLNILLDAIYQYAIVNPKTEKEKNIMSWDWYGVENVLKKLLKNNIKPVRIRINFKHRTITLENSIVLKFKTKKVKHQHVRYEYLIKESLSVVSVEVINGEKYLDMTIEEFLKTIEAESQQAKEKASNKAQEDATEFLNKLNQFNITFGEFKELQCHYERMMYGSKDY